VEDDAMTQLKTTYQIPTNPDAPFGMGRHVNHDPQSRRFPFRTTGLLSAVFHERHVPIFDQGQLGSCTANAGLGILATGPYWGDLTSGQQAGGPDPRYPWSEDGAVRLYSDLTADDDFDGEYPPDDTGSDGLTVGKEFVKRGIVPGYRHTFALADALGALMQFPLLVGTVWTDAMFSPDAYGRITTRGAVAGGHEWIVDEYVPANAVSRGGDVLGSGSFIGGTTSWGTGFGEHGRFYLKEKDFGALLAQDGDVMVLTPPNAPAPTPEPVPGSTPTGQQVADAIRKTLTDLGL
jgi:hypothetical protein